MALETLIFDLGRTIVPFHPERGLAEWSRLSGLAPEEAKRRMQATGLPVKYERGEVPTAEFVAGIGAALGIAPEREEFAMAWSAIFAPEILIPEEWIAEWGERYRLVLLSNTNDLHFEFIRERYPVLRHFDEYVLSYRVGALKPEPAIYEAAIAAAGCAPEQCFFADDVEEFVVGARGHGIDAVQFQDAAQVRAELEQRGALLR